MNFIALAIFLVIFYLLWTKVWQPVLSIIMYEKIDKIKNNVMLSELSFANADSVRSYIQHDLFVFQKLTMDIDFLAFIMSSFKSSSAPNENEGDRHDKAGFSEDEKKYIVNYENKILDLLLLQYCLNNPFVTLLLLCLVPIALCFALVSALFEFAVSFSEKNMSKLFARIIDNLQMTARTVSTASLCGMLLIFPTFGRLEGTLKRTPTSVYEQLLQK